MCLYVMMRMRITRNAISSPDTHYIYVLYTYNIPIMVYTSLDVMCSQSPSLYYLIL